MDFANIKKTAALSFWPCEEFIKSHSIAQGVIGQGELPHSDEIEIRVSVEGSLAPAGSSLAGVKVWVFPFVAKCHNTRHINQPVNAYIPPAGREISIKNRVLSSSMS